MMKIKIVHTQKNLIKAIEKAKPNSIILFHEVCNFNKKLNGDKHE